mmetsp:Transcript_44589/g.135954  ORF Transcript_44589/g.135954 Transcript_44589/m.135954 type:complete len:86 (-) Transcript_44589:171-428(-)
MLCADLPPPPPPPKKGTMVRRDRHYPEKSMRFRLRPMLQSGMGKTKCLYSKAARVQMMRKGNTIGPTRQVFQTDIHAHARMHVRQ